jgi:hypothetical protein
LFSAQFSPAGVKSVGLAPAKYFGLHLERFKPGVYLPHFFPFTPVVVRPIFTLPTEFFPIFKASF